MVVIAYSTMPGRVEMFAGFPSETLADAWVDDMKGLRGAYAKIADRVGDGMLSARISLSLYWLNSVSRVESRWGGRMIAPDVRRTVRQVERFLHEQGCVFVAVPLPDFQYFSYFDGAVPAVGPSDFFVDWGLGVFLDIYAPGIVCLPLVMDPRFVGSDVVAGVMPNTTFEDVYRNLSGLDFGALGR